MRSPVDLGAPSTARPLTWLSTGALACGALAFTLGLASGHAETALAALDASWLFFAGLSAGSLALVAAVRISEGRWSGPMLPIAEASVAFFGWALALLVVMLIGARAFVPWAATASAGRLGTLAARQLAPTVLLFVLGRRLVEQASRSNGAGEKLLPLAVGYLLTYVVALSLWAFDWVLSLSHAPPATVIPAYYFMGAFLSGLAWTALVVAVRDVSGSDLRHDLGKLLFAFIVVWTYLLWALFLATWYGNLPEEMEPLLRRWQGPYKPVTAAVIVAVFVWPFWLLFSEKLKRRRGTLALGAAITLLGLWAERFLLVLPSLELPEGSYSLLVGGGVALGVAGLFFLSVQPRLAAVDAAPAPRVEEAGSAAPSL